VDLLTHTALAPFGDKMPGWTDKTSGLLRGFLKYQQTLRSYCKAL